MENPVQILEFCFNSAYFLGMIPFRFQFCRESNSYVLIRSVGQTIVWIVVCVFTSFNCLYYTFDEYNTIVKYRGTSNLTRPEIHFRRANLITEIFIFIFILITHSAKSKEFLRLMNILQESKGFERFPNSVRRNKFYVLGLFFFSGTMFFIAMIKYFILESWDWTKGIDLLKKEGIDQFYFISEVPNSILYTFIFASIRTLTKISYALYMCSCLILLLSSCFVLNSCVNQFSNLVKDSESTGLEVYNDFMALKATTGIMNEALGLLTFGVAFGLLPYFVVSFASFVNPEDLWDSVFSFADLSEVYFFMGFAANIARKGNIVIDKFIHEKDLSELSPFQLNSLLYEARTCSIGFSCAGFCNISPELLGKMFQLLLTFSIILIQFKLPLT